MTHLRHRLKSRQILSGLTVGSLLLFSVAGCSTSEPTEVTPTAPETYPVIPEVIPLPLTGEPAPDGIIPQHPAVSVKIPADRGSQPQSGLESADNVWVQMVEGGTIRYTAVFFSQLPSSIGPVRSVRPMDGDINAPLNGIFVCSGGQDNFINETSSKVAAFYTENNGGYALQRITTRRAPYNLYLDASGIVTQAQEELDNTLTAPAQQWQFAKDVATAAASGQSVQRMTVNYPSAQSGWTWQDNKWLRSTDGEASLDADGNQLRSTNVVVLWVATQGTGAVDPAGSPVIESVMVGSGDALVAVGGKTISGTWKKDSPTDPYTLLDNSGEPILLAPGNTWIEAIPQENTIEEYQ